MEENVNNLSIKFSEENVILLFLLPSLRWKVREAFQGNEIGMIMEPTKLSRYYRLGSLEGNMIFESPNELPREVMLEMTLNAFGFDMDFIEVQSPIKVRHLLDVLGMNAMVLFLLLDWHGG